MKKRPTLAHLKQVFEAELKWEVPNNELFVWIKNLKASNECSGKKRDSALNVANSKKVVSYDQIRKQWRLDLFSANHLSTISNPEMQWYFTQLCLYAPTIALFEEVKKQFFISTWRNILHSPAWLNNHARTSTEDNAPLLFGIVFCTLPSAWPRCNHCLETTVIRRWLIHVALSLSLSLSLSLPLSLALSHTHSLPLSIFRYLTWNLANHWFQNHWRVVGVEIIDHVAGDDTTLQSASEFRNFSNNHLSTAVRL